MGSQLQRTLSSSKGGVKRLQLTSAIFFSIVALLLAYKVSTFTNSEFVQGLQKGVFVDPAVPAGGARRPRSAPPGPPPCPGCIVSSITLRGNLNENSTFGSRLRYRFTNVLLSANETLEVFLPPDQPLPTEPYVVNTVLHNGSEPRLPTELYYRVLSPRRDVSLNVNYVHASEEAQPQCRRWEERPVYVLQMTHPRNVWHVMSDALMGAFQTLREEGLLPLAEIDAKGNMAEYTADLDAQCPWTLDVDGDREPYREPECRPRRFLVTQRRCARKETPWCAVPGLAAVNRTAGPILLLAQHSEPPDQKWREMFHALSEDLRPWEAEVGTCFREIYFGRSTTLDFYTTIFQASPGFESARALRRGALAAFQRLVVTAERERRTLRRNLEPAVANWTGYADARLEKLRQGITGADLEALQVLHDLRIEASTHLGLRPEDVAEIHEKMKEQQADMRALIAEREEEDAALAAAHPPPEDEDDARGRRRRRREEEDANRPVVTFMWRRVFKRCVINEIDILEYLLTRYDVTVRVTTFEEPVLETMELMNSTDVLLGMHGAGWTNALFLKHGAGALQLHPYGWMVEKTSSSTVMASGSPTATAAADAADMEGGEGGSGVTTVKAPLRGLTYANIVRALDCAYRRWVNPRADLSFVRPYDFDSQAWKGAPLPFPFNQHPQPEWPLPEDENALPHWIYQNTLVSIRNLAPKLDSLLQEKGIWPRAPKHRAAVKQHEFWPPPAPPPPPRPPASPPPPPAAPSPAPELQEGREGAGVGAEAATA